MAAALALRTDFTAGDLRRHARQMRDANQARRLLALATEGGSRSATIPDDLLAHVAPLGWEHIALTGDYVWTNSSAAPDFRPLRDVPSAFMARAA